MLHEYVSKWIQLEREKGNDKLYGSTVGVLYDFAYWLESDAELQRAADQRELSGRHGCSCCTRDFSDVDCVGCWFYTARSKRSAGA